jgi:hypothetical protein
MIPDQNYRLMSQANKVKAREFNKGISLNYNTSTLKFGERTEDAYAS